MAVKSRDPQELADNDLVTFGKDEVIWLAGQAGQPDISPRKSSFLKRI